MDTIILFMTFHRLEYTKKSLSSLYETTRNFDLFIFDNGSNLDLKKYLLDFQDRHKNVKLYFSDVNLGIARSMNLFFKLFKNEYKYLAKVDNDAIMSDNWLEYYREVVNVFDLDIVGGKHHVRFPDKRSFGDWVKKLPFKIHKDKKIWFTNLVSGNGCLIRSGFIDKYGYIIEPDFNRKLNGWSEFQCKCYKQCAKIGLCEEVFITQLDIVKDNVQNDDYREYSKMIEPFKRWKR